MTELHQILGSLFSDIAQSIFTSDLYSRDISRYYEQDGLLRHFPVPRTEISELEVNLKFAISEIEFNPTQGIEREANAATVFVDFSYTLSEIFYEQLHEVLLELRNKGKIISKDLLAQAASGVNKIYLSQALLRFFQHNKGNLIEEGTFQVERASAEILNILRKHLDNVVGEHLDHKEKNDVFNRVTKAINLKSRLNALEDPLSFAWDRVGDFKMDVEITADKLGELNSELLSSVRVRTHVRNYKWSEVDHQGGTWWTLHPE